MGMVGSGTNNARLAAMLCQLAQYHAKDPNNLFMVHLVQGLTHLGKGILTLCPYHSDRQLESSGRGWAAHCACLFPGCLQHHPRQVALCIIWIGGCHAAPNAGHI